MKEQHNVLCCYADAISGLSFVDERHSFMLQLGRVDICSLQISVVVAIQNNHNYV